MQLKEICKNVLEKNWRGNFTIPSPRLYPFQWNWDSGFISIGNLHVNPERSILEMETLFEGQWKNGFLPHIIFHNSDQYTSYFPSSDYWDSQISDESPAQLKTSGITQPPVHGFVLEYLYNYGFEKERISSLFDKVVNYHNYLYSFRQFKDSGLTAIWHNWESGMDNSIWWDETLNGIEYSRVKNISLNRKDINEVENGEQTRPKDLDYKRYLYLIDELHKRRYNTVSNEYPFQILDPVFNAILIESNASLLRLGKALEKDTSFLQSKMERGISSFSNYLWNQEDSLYYPFDIVSGEQIKKHCSGCYVPLFAKIPSQLQATELIKHFGEYPNHILLPSCFSDQEGFERKNYWRGPVWVNINWMVWKGLLKYNMVELADNIKKETISLVEKYGSYEYFDPFVSPNSENGYGGADFSWTAALIIDMIKSETI